MTSVSTDRRFGINSGAAVKVPCRCATTAAITLNGLQTIDGITVVADDRVLVKNQASSIANGIYSASTGNWARAPDFDGKFDVKSGTLILVNGGTANGTRSWRLTSADPVLIGSSAMTFALADIGGGASLSDASLSVLRDEAGSLPTTQHAVNQLGRYYNVRTDAGALGNGVADDTTAVHLARDAVGVGGTIFFPAPGTYIVAGLAANVASQTWIIQPGATLKLKNASVLNVLVVSGNDFTFSGAIDGNRASAGGGGCISVISGTLRPFFDVKVSEWTSYGIYAPNVTSLKVRGSFSGGNNSAIFNTNDGTGVTDLQGPDIDVSIDLSSESVAITNLGIDVRGRDGFWSYVNAAIKAKIRMPTPATNSSAVSCQVWTTKRARIDIQSFGGSMTLSCYQVIDSGGMLIGKSFSYYGLEIGGGCQDCFFTGTLDGTNDAGTKICLYPLAWQGITGGTNVRCSWNGTIRGATGSRAINYSNGQDCHFAGEFFGGAATYIINDQSQGAFSLAGRFYSEGGAGQFIALLSNSIGGVDIRGYAKDFTNGGTQISSTTAITVNNISQSVNFNNCNGGGYVTSLTTNSSLGEHINGLGCTGQFIGGTQFRADIVNLKRSIYEFEGAGSPLNNVAAGTSSRFRRNDGGAATCLYVQEAATVTSTGWVAK